MLEQEITKLSEISQTQTENITSFLPCGKPRYYIHMCAHVHKAWKKTCGKSVGEDDEVAAVKPHYIHDQNAIRKPVTLRMHTH